MGEEGAVTERAHELFELCRALRPPLVEGFPDRVRRIRELVASLDRSAYDETMSDPARRAELLAVFLRMPEVVRAFNGVFARLYDPQGLSPLDDPRYATSFLGSDRERLAECMCLTLEEIVRWAVCGPDDASSPSRFVKETAPGAYVPKRFVEYRAELAKRVAPWNGNAIASLTVIAAVTDALSDLPIDDPATLSGTVGHTWYLAMSLARNHLAPDSDVGEAVLCHRITERVIGAVEMSVRRPALEDFDELGGMNFMIQSLREVTSSIGTRRNRGRPMEGFETAFARVCALPALFAESLGQAVAECCEEIATTPSGTRRFMPHRSLVHALRRFQTLRSIDDLSTGEGGEARTAPASVTILREVTAIVAALHDEARRLRARSADRDWGSQGTFARMTADELTEGVRFAIEWFPPTTERVLERAFLHTVSAALEELVAALSWEGRGGADSSKNGDGDAFDHAIDASAFLARRAEMSRKRGTISPRDSQSVMDATARDLAAVIRKVSEGPAERNERLFQRSKEAASSLPQAQAQEVSMLVDRTRASSASDRRPPAHR